MLKKENIENIKIKSSSELTNVQKIIAERLTNASRSIPHLLQNDKADVTNLISIIEEKQKKISSDIGIKITFTDILIKVCAAVLRENLLINSSYKENKFIVYDDINIGLAISTEDYLVVGTIYKADKLGIIDIVKRKVELINRAKSKQLLRQDVTKSTFTITNLGMFGIRSCYGIINPPQAALLAVGKIYTEPAFIDGKILPRNFVEISISADHRIINGSVAAKFLHKITELLENARIAFK